MVHDQPVSDPVTPTTSSEQADSHPRAVTSTARRPDTPAAERKRLQRERERQLTWVTEDWRLFIDLSTLPQKAGCQPEDLRGLVLKELADNGLDLGASVTLDCIDGIWVITDDGPGLDPATVPILFCVNRPLLSSKLKRLPLRGMLGNGLRVVVGAVAATDGTLFVETRGRRLGLAVDLRTGLTKVTSDEVIPLAPGLTVRLAIEPTDAADAVLARNAILISKLGEAYAGPSSPWWYGVKDFAKLFEQAAPAHTTVGEVCRYLGFDVQDDRAAPTLTREDANHLLLSLRGQEKPVEPVALGFIGKNCQPGWPGYARKLGTSITQAGARIPFVVEAWATCSPTVKKGQGNVHIDVVINRSFTRFGDDALDLVFRTKGRVGERPVHRSKEVGIELMAAVHSYGLDAAGCFDWLPPSPSRQIVPLWQPGMWRYGRSRLKTRCRPMTSDGKVEPLRHAAFSPAVSLGIQKPPSQTRGVV